MNDSLNKLHLHCRLFWYCTPFFFARRKHTKSHTINLRTGGHHMTTRMFSRRRSHQSLQKEAKSLWNCFMSEWKTKVEEIILLYTKLSYPCLIVQVADIRLKFTSFDEFPRSIIIILYTECIPSVLDEIIFCCITWHRTQPVYSSSFDVCNISRI